MAEHLFSPKAIEMGHCVAEIWDWVRWWLALDRKLC
jgi:hypothetical protein